jgi:hypothetical protein
MILDTDPIATHLIARSFFKSKKTQSQPNGPIKKKWVKNAEKVTDLLVIFNSIICRVSNLMTVNITT